MITLSNKKIGNEERFIYASRFNMCKSLIQKIFTFGNITWVVDSKIGKFKDGEKIEIKCNSFTMSL